MQVFKRAAPLFAAATPGLAVERSVAAIINMIDLRIELGLQHPIIVARVLRF
jgi:hypothetical protein